MSKARVPIKEVAPILQKVREILLGRPHTLALRFDPDVSTRNPPLPDLPDGPSHRLSANYYYSRDARSEVKPPDVVVSATDPKLLEAGSAEASSARKRLPGNTWQWD